MAIVQMSWHLSVFLTIGTVMRLYTGWAKSRLTVVSLFVSRFISNLSKS